jgi:hypothetical protein
MSRHRATEAAPEGLPRRELARDNNWRPGVANCVYQQSTGLNRNAPAMNSEQKAYEKLLSKVDKVFGETLDKLSPTQEAVVNRLLDLSVEESGGADKVTLAQVQGVKEMLEEEFGLAAVDADSRS